MDHDFRAMLYPLDHPRLAMAHGLDARGYGHMIRSSPMAGPMFEAWIGLTDEPFRGLTFNGECESGLFALAQEGAPTAAMTAAAKRLISELPPEKKAKLHHPIDAAEWRYWSNPEILVKDCGLRLEDESHDTRAAVLALIEASLSAKGFTKTRDCMRINAFLGELTGLPLILNQWSYNILLFGEPSETEPWGWNIYGHHLALNCFVLGRQMVISPTFMGAEPNLIDTGPYAGTSVLLDEERMGLALMRDLSPAQRAQAQIFTGVNDPALAAGRNHPADQFHLGGAYQDNRVVPPEGVPVGAFTLAQKDKLMEATAAFLAYLPQEPLRHRLAQIERHLDRSWWSWIGGWGDDDTFYYRFQNPVVMAEFDHHAGVWLANTEPAKCHIHTVVRTPNGNDYGKDLLRQHYAETHPGHDPGRNLSLNK